MKTALAEVRRILESIRDDGACIPGTLLYNEGWLLRLALAAGSDGIDCLPFRFEPTARWFSEALLHSAFLPRFRGDELAESLTHADAVVGQFRFDAATKAGLVLEPGCSQFVVCEAKVFSRLSAGTKRAVFRSGGEKRGLHGRNTLQGWTAAHVALQIARFLCLGPGVAD